MNKSVNQMCRVCMSAGSRNIFKKSSAPGGIVGGSDAGGETSATNTTSITTASNNNNNSNNNPSQSQTSMLDNCSSSSSASSSVSSLEKLLEKLRYVTLIKIDETDNLPRLICDLCIIQLNVAYNFKRQAIATDTNLRQFVIENGFNLNDPYENNGKQDHHHHHHHHRHRPASDRRQCLRQDSPLMATPTNHLPFLIKSEPVDYEIMSDITIETNTETAYDSGLNTSVSCASLNNHQQQQQQPPAQSKLFALPQSSMVQLNNNNNLLGRTNVGIRSDREFISNYLPAAVGASSSSLTDDEQQQQQQQPPSSYMDLVNAKEDCNSPALIVANVKSKSSDVSESPKTDEDDETPSPPPLPPPPPAAMTATSSQKSPPVKVRRKRNRELTLIASHWGKGGGGVDQFSTSQSSADDGYALRRINREQLNKIPRKVAKSRGTDEVINPAANRLRQRIKTELLSESLSDDQLLSNADNSPAARRLRLSEKCGVQKKTSNRQPLKKSKIRDATDGRGDNVNSNSSSSSSCKMQREKINRLREPKPSTVTAAVEINSKHEFKAFKRST